jgi:hypothetical protein
MTNEGGRLPNREERLQERLAAAPIPLLASWGSRMAVTGRNQYLDRDVDTLLAVNEVLLILFEELSKHAGRGSDPLPADVLLRHLASKSGGKVNGDLAWSLEHALAISTP